MVTPKYHVGDFVKIASADKIRAAAYEISWSYEQIKWHGFHAKVKGFRCIDNHIYYMLDGVFDIPIYLWSEEFLESAAKYENKTKCLQLNMNKIITLSTKTAFFIARPTPNLRQTMKFSRLRKGAATASMSFAALNVLAAHGILETTLSAALIIGSGVGQKNRRR